MQEFNFMGSDAANKPEPIKAKGNIVGSASQKMCLFRLLSFFVDISKSAMVLKLYLVSREIMMYAFSRCISRQDLDYYAQKIKVLYQLMKEHFSHIRITPKFHYLLHYPSMTAKFGPLCNLWCMRFEAKHQYFKALASNIGSFRNIAFTLATRHQLSHCYNFSNKEVLESRMFVNSGKSILINSLPTHVQQFVYYNKTKIWSSSEVVIDTCTLSTGALIIIDFINDGDPVFLKIEHLLIPHTGHLDIIGNYYCLFDSSKNIMLMK